MNEKDTINICYMTDDKFSPVTGISILSCLENTKHPIIF